MGWKNAVGGGLGLGRPSANPGLESTIRQKVIITILMTGSNVDPSTMFLFLAYVHCTMFNVYTNFSFANLFPFLFRIIPIRGCP